MQIRELEEQRRQVLEEREKLELQIKKKRESELAKVAGYQNKDIDIGLKREELRLQRQKEEKEREWRQQQLEKAKINQERQQLIRETRDQQVELKKHVRSESAKVERDFWENQISAWRDSVEEARVKEETRQKNKLQYQRDLQLQIENNNNLMKQSGGESVRSQLLECPQHWQIYYLRTRYQDLTTK